MTLWTFLKNVTRRLQHDTTRFSVEATKHNLDAAVMHTDAAKEYDRAAKRHRQAAQLHVLGSHGDAARKGNEAKSASDQGTDSAKGASTAERDARKQNDLD